jgi:quercetin 2,3-dioxygenase
MKNSNFAIAIKRMKEIKRTWALSGQWQTLDPFLFCVYHKDLYPQGNGELGPDFDLTGRKLGSDFEGKDGFSMYHGKQIPGFPGHPHMGFETITFVKQGFVDHADSMGAKGRYGNGDVQWMTAGRGVQHSEMFPLLETNAPNTLELFQIWLNLAGENKQCTPHINMMWNENVPIVEETDNKGNKSWTKVIHGTYKNTVSLDANPHSWAANPENEVGIWQIKLAPNAQIILPPSLQDINRCIYIYQGEGVGVNGQILNNMHACEINSMAEIRLQNGNQFGEVLVLQGKPIKDNVIQYGPFVTRTEGELKRVLSVYHATEFGGWPWPLHEMTHGKEKRRFAQHADGSIEEKPV